LFLAIIFALCIAGITIKPVSSLLNIIHYKGPISNCYILHDGVKVLFIDSTNTYQNGEAAYNTTVLPLGLPVAAIYLTHYHPDHIGGVPGILAHAPTAKVYVANETARQALLATYFNAYGLTFNYTAVVENLPVADVINVLAENLTVCSNFLPSEADVTSIAYYAPTNSLFAGDTVYDNTALFLGPTVDGTKLENWIALVAALQTKYPTSVIYPGHGEITNMTNSAFQTTEYLNYFKQALCKGDNITTLVSDLAARFPTYDNFTLSYIPLNAAAWQTYQNYLIRNTTFCNQFTPAPTPAPTPTSGSIPLYINIIFVFLAVFSTVAVLL